MKVVFAMVNQSAVATDTPVEREIRKLIHYAICDIVT